jgi:teichuronic acid biosynthesis glycosyltransferase TuaC
MPSAFRQRLRISGRNQRVERDRRPEDARMRVLVVTNMYPSVEEPWLGCFVKEQIEDLRALGFEMHVLHFDGRRDWRNYIRAARDVRSLSDRDGIDLVHAHYGLTGATALVQRTLPVITTFHGSDFTGAVPWQANVSRVVARLCTPIFVSEEATRRLRIPTAAVIPAGVDTQLFVPHDRAWARAALGWAEGGPYVLLAGARGSPLKRADLFDAAMREARRTVPKLRPVSLEGFGRADVALVMNAVDVTVMTSDWEGSPVAIKESLACMTPVVSVPVGDVPQVIAGLPGCAIVPRDPYLIANAVLQALDADRRQELRERAESFSRKQVAERVAAVYRDVAGARRA